MSTNEFLSKVYSQDSRQVKEATAATIREKGPSRGIVSAIGLGLLVACLLICGLATVTCRFEFDPLHLECPGGNETPVPTTVTPGTQSPSATMTPTNTPTTITPATTAAPTDTPTPTNTNTPTTPVPCTQLTPSPDMTQKAIALAQELAGQFASSFGVQINAQGAVPFNPICFATDSDQLLGMIAPAVDENQTYKGREVEGIFYTNDPRFVIETLVLLNKTAVQYSTLPLGSYMLACNHQRLDDCIAVSLQGQEFQIRPESVDIQEIPEVRPPTVAYEEGSIRKCFKVLKRKICIRVF